MNIAQYQKQPLVLIPGTLNDEELWREQIAALQDIADCYVADITKATTIETMAESVLAASPEFSFAMAGFSLGGVVAQEVLRQAPERISRLALLNTKFLPDTPQQKKMRQRVIAMAQQEGEFIGIGQQMLKTYLHPDHHQNVEMTERVRSMTSRLGAETLIRQNRVEHKDGTETLKAFKGPALVTGSKDDMITPLIMQQKMAELLENARFVLVPDAGHLTPIEQPDMINAAMREWLLR